MASHTGIDFFDPHSGASSPLRCAREATKPANRSNDGKCDRQGRFWYGTMMNNFADDMSETPITANTGGLYRIDPDGTVHTFRTGTRHRQHFRLEPRREHHVFRRHFRCDLRLRLRPADRPDRQSPHLRQGRHERYGHPDGSTIDAEGCLWNARWDGGCIIRWAPDGRIDRVVKLPCRRVTSCIFGGPDLDTLYVTTVRYGLSEAELAEQPLAGGIFALDAGVQGPAGWAVRGVAGQNRSIEKAARPRPRCRTQAASGAGAPPGRAAPCAPSPRSWRVASPCKPRAKSGREPVGCPIREREAAWTIRAMTIALPGLPAG